MVGGAPVRVFISYAHEPAVDPLARDLWLGLSRLGLDVRIDLTAEASRQDWTLYMLEQLREADYVLVVASEAYRRRAEGAEEPDVGRGVQFEASLIRDAFYGDQRAGRTRFLPVVLPGQGVEGIPVFLSPHAGTHYRVDSFDLAGLEKLVRVLTGQAGEVQPERGSVPVLAPRPHLLSSEQNEEVVAERAGARPGRHELLVDVTVDGGRLVSRVVLAGAELGVRSASAPYGWESIWGALDRRPEAADGELARMGRALADALLGAETLGAVARLVDGSVAGTVLDVVLVAEGPGLRLPVELLRLADGRLLATVPGVRMRRRMRGVDRPSAGRLAGPVKVLVAVAAPEETRTPNPPLDGEAEMRTVIDALGALTDDPDRPAVRILEVASPAAISEALRDDEYHVLHLSAHGSADAVELEDEDGNPVEVTTEELVEVLRAGEHRLPLVVLSSCSAAGAGGDGLAAGLIAHGADRVLAMQTTVTDGYATALAGRLYRHLTTAPTIGVADALAWARREVDQTRLAALRAGDPHPPRPEYGVATLLAAGDDPPLTDPSLPPVALSRATRPPAGGGVHTLDMGQLIGRRRALRETTRVLRGGPAAARYGAVAGVVLTGVGGIGKTAVAGRVLARLADDGWSTAVHIGRFDPTTLTTAVADAVRDDPACAQALAALEDLTRADTGKLAVVGQLLAGRRLLVLFDDFEANLTPGGAGFDDAAFAALFDGLCQTARTGKLLITCRYPIPDAGVFLHRVDLAPLSRAERDRMLLRLPNLTGLSPADRVLLAATIGGHPRLLEFADALLRGGRAATLTEVTTRLRALARAENLPLTPGRTISQAVADAVRLGARDILLAGLLDLLTPSETALLLQAAISPRPAAVDDLAYALTDGHPDPDSLARTRADAARLGDLTLLTATAEGGDRFVHPWIADALTSHQREQATDRHRRAAAMRLHRVNTGRGGYSDLVDVVTHTTATGEHTRAVSLARQAADLLAGAAGELTVATYLAETLPHIPPDTSGYLDLADRERQALWNTGNITAALARTRTLLTLARARAEADPSNAQAQRDLSVFYNRLGEVMVAVGKLGEAERFYRDDLAIAVRLAEADPSNAQAQRDLSISYNKLGQVMVAVGKLGEAERFYRDSLAIAVRLAEADPSNAQAQRDLSISYERLGQVMVAVGNLGEAERFYRDSLAIAVRLAEADPSNAQAQRDLSISYTQLGQVMVAVGKLGEAERFYRDGLAIRVRLAEADPSNAEAQRDLSISYERLGQVMVAVGNLGEAERFYRDGLAIRVRLAEADPSNAADTAVAEALRRHLATMASRAESS